MKTKWTDWLWWPVALAFGLVLALWCGKEMAAEERAIAEGED